MKPLSSWQLDLDARLNFINTWIEKGKPVCFWISGFYFPQAFLTGTLQNHARKYNVEIDRLEFNTYYKPEDVTSQTITEPPTDGVYVFGMYMEGARWDYADKAIRPSMPKVLYTEFPLMHFEPKLDRKAPDGIYRCPVYKVLSRRGTLSTTGHSTNFVMWVELPGGKKDIKNNLGLSDQEYWIKAGVAM